MYVYRLHNHISKILFTVIKYFDYYYYILEDYFKKMLTAYYKLNISVLILQTCCKENSHTIGGFIHFPVLIFYILGNTFLYFLHLFIYFLTLKI